MVFFGLDANSKARPLLVDSEGRVLVSAQGFINGAFQKSPLPFGPSRQQIDNVTNNSIVAGTSNQFNASVPAGEVWVFTNISILTSAAIAAGYINISIAGAGGSANLFRQPTPAASILYTVQGYWVLFPGAYINYLIVGGVGGAIFVGSATGFAMDIDL